MANSYLDAAGVQTLWKQICNNFVIATLIDSDGNGITDSTGENITGFGNIALCAYPVGSVYISVSSTSPAGLFGGTWERIQDKFLLGSGSSYSLGSTGGEATHRLTVSEIPSHNHAFNSALHWSESSGVQKIAFKTGTTGNAGTTNLDTVSVGGGAAHNNMPPYLAVNIWKRIS